MRLSYIAILWFLVRGSRSMLKVENLCPSLRVIYRVNEKNWFEEVDGEIVSSSWQ